MARLPSGALVVFLAAAAAACGSRSALDADAAGEGGSGGAGGAPPGTTSGTTGTTTPSTGGTGGTGGTAASCDVLELAGPPAWLEGGFGHHERHPAWALSSDDGARVTLVSSRQPAEGPAGSDFPLAILHTSLQPWFDFPKNGVLGESHTAHDDADAPFAAARAVGDRFALLFPDPSSPDGGLSFSNDFVPGSGGLPATLLADATTAQALFVAQGPGGHLLGMQSVGFAGGGETYLLRAAFAGEDGAFAGPADLGCASGPMVADAVGAGDRWLMALSNGGPLGGGECLDPGAGAPYDVQIVVAFPGSFEQTDVFGAPGGATDVKVAPAPGGAWVVAGTPPGQVLSGTFIGARVDLDGKILFTFPVTTGDPDSEFIVNGTLAVAGVGDHLLAAWVDWGGGMGPHLRVRAFDAEGNGAGQIEIFPAWGLSGAPALLGSPLTPSAVLAWADLSDPGQQDGDKIRAVRIDCVGAP